MIKIKLESVSRKYILDKTSEFYAVKNVSLSFEDTGMVAICGKSGSGKSTVLNMIGKLDSPTEGKVIFDNVDITKIKEKEKTKYYKDKIGILFQNYNLLEDHSVLFNVALPLIICGEKKANAFSKAKEALAYVGISSLLYASKASLLSGGEKQRVALARTIINKPEVILCDEPTGALDSKNSINVMKILKDYSKNNLVIMVSHNLQLTEKYSDRIIELSEGKIVSDRTINDLKEEHEIKKNTNKKSSSWIDNISTLNFKKRFKRNLFSLSALVISLTLGLLTIGFMQGKDESINNASVRQLDFATGTLSKEEVLSKGSVLSLSRVVRPELQDVYRIKNIRQNFHICLNFDAIFPSKMNLNYDEEPIEDPLFYPVYSFVDSSINRDIISKGSVPSKDTLNEVIINDSCYSYLKDKLKKEPLGEYLSVSHSITYSYVDFDGTYVDDEFIYEENIKIKGIANELSYLQTPKIYYSYIALEEYVGAYLLPNLSTYFNEDVSWYDRILNVDDFAALSSFSYRLFLKDYNKSSLFFDDSVSFDNLSFSSNSLLIRESLLSFMQVGEYAMLLFLALTIIGTILILGIMSFTSYSEDHKSSAILTCLGATNEEIMEIYLNESLTIGFVSFLLSILISYLASFGINTLINNLINLKDLIKIPFLSFNGVPFLFPLIVFVLIMFICIFVTIIPIIFSKKISLKEELQSL